MLLLLYSECKYTKLYTKGKYSKHKKVIYFCLLFAIMVSFHKK